MAPDRCRLGLENPDAPATRPVISHDRGVEGPEKRRRIGHAFIECFKEEAKGIQDARFLAQGTLYPDVIESGAAHDGPAATIKLHHNVGGLPAELGFELVEPLRDLFKDEVRELGLALGLATALAIATVGRDGISSILFGVSALDPLTYVAVFGLVTLISLFSVFVPARRATHVRPEEALRAE